MRINTRLMNMTIMMSLAVGAVFCNSGIAHADEKYVVVTGDTLSEIAHQVHVPWRVIAEANNIKAPWTIYTDQRLVIPNVDPKDTSTTANRIKYKVRVHKLTISDVNTSVAVDKYGLSPAVNSPESLKAASLLGPMFGIKSIGGFAPGVGHAKNSDHYTGHAVDLIINDLDNGRAVGDAIVAYVLDHLQELNIKYLIWYKQIWSVARSDEGWRPYHGASDHTDHVHLSFVDDGFVPQQ